MDLQRLVPLDRCHEDEPPLLGDVEGVKAVLRLAPPKKGHEGIKHSFRAGGALGDRGDRISELALRMV
jgi:large subunit ribosomal protein L30